MQFKVQKMHFARIGYQESEKAFVRHYPKNLVSLGQMVLITVFIAGTDGATGVAQVSGGGGTSNDMPWRDKDEDYLHWAYRAMRYAHAKHYPGNRLKRSLSK